MTAPHPAWPRRARQGDEEKSRRPAQPLVASAAAHLLVATTLAVFPGNTLTDPTIEDRHDAHPDTLRRSGP